MADHPAGETWGRPWVPRYAARFVVLVGILDIAALLTPHMWLRVRRLTELLPGTFTSAATAAIAVTGVALLFLASGLARRKRRAWLLTCLLLAGSVAFHLVEGPNVILATFSAALLAVLIWGQAEFAAEGDPTSRMRALLAFLSLGLLSFIVGFLVVQEHADEVAPGISTKAIIGDTLLGFFGVTTPLTSGPTRTDDLIYYTLFWLGILTIGTTLYFALRSPRPHPQLTDDDRTRIRGLLETHGGQDSLGYFALRDDKSVVWSKTGKACILYRVVSGVMLASGDPLGDLEAWPGAIAAFLAQAKAHAWVPGVVGCSERAAMVWSREANIDAIEIGDEAVVDVREFTLEGRAMRNVRQMVRRVERAGYMCTARRMSDLEDAELSSLRRLAETWRIGDVERGFSMALGRFGGPGDDRCVVVTAEEASEVKGLLLFVPWGREGLSLDLMRRDPQADPGVNELMISYLLGVAPSLDVCRVSLNFAVFRSALERGGHLGAGPVVRLWRRMLLIASRWTQIESLYRFNAKFRPIWEPRYVLFPGAVSAPRVALAYLRAEAFLPSFSRTRRHKLAV